MRGRENEGVRRRERRSGERKEEFSVFVLNIPRLLDKYGLFGIFQRAGQVYDTYIPVQQNRKGTRKYGFVRFRREEDVRRCIQLFHGAIVRGNKIIVTKANPKRNLQEKTQRHQGNQNKQVRQSARKWWIWRPKDRNATQSGKGDTFKDERETLELSIIGETNEANEEWLCRSLIGRVEEPRELASLSSAIQCDFDPYVKIGALSSFQYLITFPSEARMKEALDQKETLFQWFSDVKRWGVEDRCEARRVWLDIMGVPPQGWMWENFKKIAEIWGSLVCLGKQSTATDSFEVMKVCIATKILSKIQGELVLLLGSCGYRIIVSEAEIVSQAGNFTMRNAIPKEDDHVPGFEDLEDIEESEDENFHSNHQDQGRVEEDDLPNSNSKIRQGQGSHSSNDSKQDNTSPTKTKTVSFSIGNSEEICRARQQLMTLAAQECNEGSSPTSLPPPGFEFESPTSAQLEKNQPNCEVAQEVSNSTEVTSDSLRKLAHESLAVGELLGVKVIGDYKAALSRITKPLKKNKGWQRSHWR